MKINLVFTLIVILSFAIFFFNVYNRVIKNFFITKCYEFKLSLIKRITLLIKQFFFQKKLFRFFSPGILHFVVFWGFILILFSSMEMIIDGITNKENSLFFLGKIYRVLMFLIDVFAYLVLFVCICFMLRRALKIVKRFEKPEIKKRSKYDAYIILTLIIILMITLIINNIYLVNQKKYDFLMLSNLIFGNVYISNMLKEVSWWLHILLVLFFLNILPFSKHFHILTSFPNIFLSRLEPLGLINNMDSVTKNVKIIMNETEDIYSKDIIEENVRYGTKDIEDLNWKTYLDSLTCTECGRCASVCPANLTGKKLSPRKIMMDIRKRFNEKQNMRRKGIEDDNKDLFSYIGEEEIWACTLCNSCALECPLSINQPQVIIDMRRYLVLEKGKSMEGLSIVYSNIENNGAPWQYPKAYRVNWIKELDFDVPIFSDVYNKKEIEFLFWVGCAGAYDYRYKKVVKAFAKLLKAANINFGVLGEEETCTGDIAKRTGNEFLFQLQAFANISTFKKYNIRKIITTCPHCYNILKNEYPLFGYKIDVIHYTEFINKNLKHLNFKVKKEFENELVTFHDPCYLGKCNGIYKHPRLILKRYNLKLKESRYSKTKSICCGAGGGQFFKESEIGGEEIYLYRVKQLLKTNCKYIITACPFCIHMLEDGLKKFNKEDIKVLDILEIFDF